MIGKTIIGKYINGSIVKGIITEYRMRYEEIIYYVTIDGTCNSVIIRQSNVVDIC